MTLHGSIWLHMTPYVSLWLSMAPYSSLWFPIAPYDTHMAHYESYVTLSNMQLFMKFLNSPWLSMALYDLIWIPMSACDFLWLPIAPYGFKIIESFGHKMFISSQSKLCIWSKNFFDKSCSVWLPNKGDVIFLFLIKQTLQYFWTLQNFKNKNEKFKSPQLCSTHATSAQILCLF